jgi:hypothetical protein
VICSIQKIEFTPTGGAAVVLLDFGDFTQDEIAFPAEQAALTYTPLGASWSRSTAQGGARSNIDFTRRDEHPSHAAARSWCQQVPLRVFLRRAGVIRVTILGGETWHHLDSVILGCSSVPVRSSTGYRTHTSYRILTGKRVPVAGLEYYPGIPIGWDLTPIGTSAAIIGTGIVPPPSP